MNSPPVPNRGPLLRVALETERYVAAAGWDQPPRLFALVRTADLLSREPGLAAQLGGHLGERDADPFDGLTAVEQDGVPRTASLESLLARLAWPPDVHGVALAVERIVVPPEAERDLPGDAEEAMSALAEHRDRRDVRLLVAVLRDGGSTCLLRQRQHDRDDRVATGADIAPGLVQALQATLLD
ncbi:MAG TPA: PPA1309 family protein [Dermatophilaceae bacterium]|nr:PPA1309 family protein [Dermatophilaceae bacterium]